MKQKHEETSTTPDKGSSAKKAGPLRLTINTARVLPARPAVYGGSTIKSHINISE